MGWCNFFYKKVNKCRAKNGGEGQDLSLTLYILYIYIERERGFQMLKSMMNSIIARVNWLRPQVSDDDLSSSRRLVSDMYSALRTFQLDPTRPDQPKRVTQPTRDSIKTLGKGVLPLQLVLSISSPPLIHPIRIFTYSSESRSGPQCPDSTFLQVPKDGIAFLEATRTQPYQQPRYDHQISSGYSISGPCYLSIVNE